MRTWLCLFLLLVAIAAVVLVVLKFPANTPPPPAPPQPKPKPVASPREVVQSYLKALEKQDYRAAYGLLSAESRTQRSYDEFAALCQKAGAPSLDAAAGVEQPGKAGRMVVLVPMVEDPAAASFNLTREEGEWRIVFTTGSPWFPYP